MAPRKKSPEERAATKKAYRESHRAELAEKLMAWRRLNREQVEANERAYYRANREWILAKKKAYHAEHLQSERARKQRLYEKHKIAIRAKAKIYNALPLTRERRIARDQVRRQTESSEAREKRLRGCKDYYQQHKDRHLFLSRLWRQKNREKVNAGNRARYPFQDKVKSAERTRLWRARNREHVNARARLNNPKRRDYVKKWAKRNRESVLRAGRKWFQSHKAQKNAYHRNRRQVDPQFRIAGAIRARMRAALNDSGVKKSHRTLELLGCSWAELVKHIESLFLNGMTWGNKHLWHLDHKRPLSSWDLSKESELRGACHFTNLQPLWALDNLRKNSKWTPPSESVPP